MVRTSLWPTRFAVYASPLLFTSANHSVLTIGDALRQRRNTRYGWVVDPYEKSSRSLSRPGLAPGKKRQASLGAPTARVIRMYLFGARHSCTLGVIASPGTRMGCERLGCPPAGMGTISRQVRSSPSRYLDTRRRLIWDWQIMPRTRIGICSSNPHLPWRAVPGKIHAPNIQGV